MNVELLALRWVIFFLFFFAFVLLCGNECEGINKNDLYYHYVDNVLLTVLMVCGSDLVNGVMDSGEFQGIDVAQGPGWLTLAVHTETGTRKYELSHKCELGSTAKRNSFRRHPNYKWGFSMKEFENMQCVLLFSVAFEMIGVVLFLG